jgi:hypothetical protein
MEVIDIEMGNVELMNLSQEEEDMNFAFAINLNYGTDEHKKKLEYIKQATRIDVNNYY